MGQTKQLMGRRIMALEARLGVQLLMRMTRKLALTELGQEYVQRARRILAEVEEADQAMASHETATRDTPRLTAPLTFGRSHLSPLLASFLKLHPEVKIDLDMTDRLRPSVAVRVDHEHHRFAPGRRLPTGRQRGTDSARDNGVVDLEPTPLHAFHKAFRRRKFDHRSALGILLQQGDGHALPAVGFAPLRLAPDFPFVLEPVDIDGTGKPVGLKHVGAPSMLVAAMHGRWAGRGPGEAFASSVSRPVSVAFLPEAR
jgi:DNA-binding transcriptional LysR family regulator